MKKLPETCVLVLEMATGPVVSEMDEKRWKKLSLTYRQTRLNLGGVPLQVKYQSWLEPAHVTQACQKWLAGEQEGAF